tara:strand:+ start:6647 stop:7198 length:552 start_codon:yes stop_codon:yes gene_type:complete
MDPFLQAKYKRGGAPWGASTRPYLEQLLQKTGALPQRDPRAFERALEYRRREIDEGRQTKSERDGLAKLLGANTDRLARSTATIRKLAEQNSKLQLDYERAVADRDSRDRSGPLPLAETDGRAASRTDEPVAGVGGLQREVLRHGPDAGGPRGEHDAEGRHAGGTDAEGSEPVRGGDVPEGGE